MKTFVITLLAGLILAPLGLADRNFDLDRYLVEHSVTFPDEYLAIADQPLGLVQQFIIFDLVSGNVTIFPGTHERKRGWQPRKGESLSDDNRLFLRTFLGSEAAQAIPDKTGKLGFDGGSLVAYYKIGNVERFISHWEPDHLGMFMLNGLFERYYTRQLKEDFSRDP